MRWVRATQSRTSSAAAMAAMAVMAVMAVMATVAAAEHVVVFPGQPWHAAEPPAAFLRLTYAAAGAAQLDEGVRRLARVLAAVGRRG
ncbi:hypothetical protein [Micromonospora sp. NPDC057141]|uniref:hypothetical protein n=1 Tax=Micromonospora sp. NPDC057141 TaxID=3346033 RepID=UPI003641F7D9